MIKRLSLITIQLTLVFVKYIIIIANRNVFIDKYVSIIPKHNIFIDKYISIKKFEDNDKTIIANDNSLIFSPKLER